jgi:hypothetical protein
MEKSERRRSSFCKSLQAGLGLCQHIMLHGRVNVQSPACQRLFTSSHCYDHGNSVRWEMINLNLKPHHRAHNPSPTSNGAAEPEQRQQRDDCHPTFQLHSGVYDAPTIHYKILDYYHGPSRRSPVVPVTAATAG